MAQERTEYQLGPGDTIFRNIRLVSTSSNIFIYIGYPLLWVAYSALVFQTFDSDKVGERVSKALFVFAICIIPGAMAMTFFSRAEKIQKQLEQQGYEQRRTRAREIDYWINWLPLAGFLLCVYYPNDKAWGNAPLSTMQLVVLLSLCVLMFWWLLFLPSLGPVLWFTVKVREREQR